MRRIYKAVAAAGTAAGSVLVVGESGTGKELVARAIHALGCRRGSAFVAVNCAAFAPGLIENELFGHQRGSYTGAQEEHLGLIRLAADGALFLDELTEMDRQAQPKLLRVIEDRKVRALGGLRELTVEARFISSTNRDPEQAMEAGILRRDLYYRLCAFRIDLPPLRAHPEDIPLLADHFARLLGQSGPRRVEGFEEAAMAALQDHHWPGNVRQLRNAIEHALASGSGERITLEQLPHELRRPAARRGRTETPEGRPIPTLAQAESDLIREALAAVHGNKRKAAELLHISRHRLYDWIRKG